MTQILIIDDDTFMCSYTASLLSRLGLTAIVALDGRAGVTRFSEGDIDLVMTDILMPEQEGLETILALRRLDPRIKILAMTGAQEGEALDYLPAAKKLGADSALRKPFTFAELSREIMRLLPNAPQ